MKEKIEKIDWLVFLYFFVFYTVGVITIVSKEYSNYKYGFYTEGNNAIIFGSISLFVSIIIFISFIKNFKKFLLSIRYVNKLKIVKFYFLNISYCVLLVACFIPMNYYLIIFIRILFSIILVYFIIYIILLDKEFKKLLNDLSLF